VVAAVNAVVPDAVASEYLPGHDACSDDSDGACNDDSAFGIS